MEYAFEINNEPKVFTVEAKNKTEARKKAHKYMREIAGHNPKYDLPYKITDIYERASLFYKL